MPVPPEYASLYDWYNGVVGNLSDTNKDFEVFRRYWGSLTAQQRTGLKNLLTAKIDDGIASLNDIKTEITNTA